MATPPDPDAPQPAPTEESAARLRRRSYSHAAAGDRKAKPAASDARRTALLVGNNDAIREALSIRLRLEKYEVVDAETGQAALAYLETRPHDVVVVGLGGTQMAPDIFLRRAKELRPEAALLVVTKDVDIPLAAHYMRLGAREVLREPAIPRRILEAIVRTGQRARPPASRPPSPRSLLNAVFVGQSDAVRQLRRHFPRVAAAKDLNVFLNGEAGTGKESLARAIHERNDASRQFVAIRAAGIPNEDFRRVMFGGPACNEDDIEAFHNGALPRAAGGTLYLDDIDGFPKKQQAQLLRVLERRRYRPVGSSHDLMFNVRLISATQRPPDPDSRYGLRGEFFARLAGAAMHLPPLRTRMEDLPILTRHFATEAARQWSGDVPRSIDDGVDRVLRRYYWPENLLELRRVVERALFYAGGLRLTRAATEKALDACTGERTRRASSGDIERAPPPDSSVTDFVVQVFQSCNQDTDSTSRRLGMSPDLLRSHLETAGVI